MYMYNREIVVIGSSPKTNFTNKITFKGNRSIRETSEMKAICDYYIYVFPTISRLCKNRNLFL